MLLLILILILPNNTTIIYDKNAKGKRCVFSFDFKMSDDLESLNSNGNAFQS